MEQQSAGSAKTKKSVVIFFAISLFIFVAIGVGFLISQNNSQRDEINRLKQNANNTNKEAEKPKSHAESTSGKIVDHPKTKEYTVGAYNDYKIEVPVDWQVSGGADYIGYGSKDWRDWLGYTFHIKTKNNREIILQEAVNPQIGGIGCNDVAVTVRKLADTGIDEYKVLELTESDGSQEVFVTTPKGIGNVSQCSYNFGQFIDIKNHSRTETNHIISFMVTDNTKDFSEQEKAEIAKVMSSFARK